MKDDPGVGARHVIQLDPRVRLPERGGHDRGGLVAVGILLKSDEQDGSTVQYMYM